MPEFGPVPGAEDEDQALPWVEDKASAPGKLNLSPPPAEPARPDPRVKPPPSKVSAPDLPPAVPVPYFEETQDASGPREAVPVVSKSPKCPRCGKSLRPGFGLCPHCLFEPEAEPARSSAAPPAAAAPLKAGEPMNAKAVRPPELTDMAEVIVAKRDNPFIWAAVGVAALAFVWVQFRGRPATPRLEPAEPETPARIEGLDPPVGSPPPAPPAPPAQPQGPRSSPFGEQPYEPKQPDILPDSKAGGKEVRIVAEPPPAAGTEAGFGWVFEGRVRDILTLAPVGSAKLKFQDFSSGTSRSATSDKRGRFRVKLPTPQGDGYFLKIDKPGYMDRFDLEGASAADLGAEDRREKAKVAAKTVQAVPLSPVAEGKLELDLLLVPVGVE